MPAYKLEGGMEGPGSLGAFLSPCPASPHVSLLFSAPHSLPLPLCIATFGVAVNMLGGMPACIPYGGT